MVLVFAVLAGLGTWQLDRLVWKQQLLGTRVQRINAPTVDYPGVGTVAWASLEAAEYRPLRLRGRYRPADSVKLLSRTRGGRAGFHVIMPFELDTESVVVLVDRGWVPVDNKGKAAPAPAGLVEVEGFVRRFEAPGRFTPDNEPASGTWFYLDRDQMASALNLDAVAQFYVQRAPGAAPSVGYPAGGVPNIALRNAHLAYAITWYALALVLLVIYVVFHLRRRVGED